MSVIFMKGIHLSKIAIVWVGRGGRAEVGLCQIEHVMRRIDEWPSGACVLTCSDI